nr:SpvB/TcaC N-terminal domain-containing protein [Luteolibacter marinus]
MLVVAWFHLVPLAHGLDTNKNGVSPNAISLPSGPGSIEGLGESFQPSLNTGTGKHALNITVPPGTAGHAPQLLIFYEGAEGNGVLGYGWQLPLTYIQRQTDKGVPRYVDGPDLIDNDLDGVTDNLEELDTFITGSAEELVPVIDGTFTSYFCENESSFTRYRRTGDHWEARTAGGVRLVFGESPAARITDPDDPTRVFRWLLERSIDTRGNEIRYTYANAAGAENLSQKYLETVSYGAGAAPWGGKFHFVRFSYEARADWFEDCRAGFPVRTGRRLTRIDVGSQGVPPLDHLAGDFNGDTIPDSLNRRYDVSYHEVPHASLVESITVRGSDGTTALPPARYGYTICNGNTALDASGQLIPSLNVPPVGFDNADTDLADMNGDGLPDLLRANSNPHRVYFNEGERDDSEGGTAIRWSGAVTIPAPTEGAGPGSLLLSSTQVTLADIDGDGLSDFVRVPGSGDSFFYRNRPGAGAAPYWEAVSAITQDGAFSPPSPHASGSSSRSLDLDFDKRMDIVRSQPSGGGFIYQAWFNLDTQRFSTRTTFTPSHGFDLAAADVKTADLNGDRLTDIARIRPAVVEVTMGLGLGSFLPLETIAIPDFALSSTDIAKAELEDVNGDGLADLVIVRPSPGNLWIWPNRGNRTFGARIVVTGLPGVIHTDATSRWADINGNGTKDLVFADRSAPAGQEIQALDIGRLMGCEPRPYLIDHIENGIGRVEEIIHTTTTEFILADGTDDQGNYAYPWAHPLPFPVTVIREVGTADSLGAEYRSEFAYHEAYYDPVEKQFRGFARVEQVDVGDATAPTLVSRSYFDIGDVEESLKGKVLRLTTEDESGSVFNDAVTEWDVRTLHPGTDGRSVSFAHQVSSTTDILEQGRGTPRRTYVEYDYDNYGNATEERNYGIVEDDDLTAFSDERLTTTTFAYNFDEWLIRLPYQVEVSDGSGQTISRSRTFYDDETFSGTNPAEVSIGNPTLVRQWTNVAADEFIAASRTTFDTFGNPIHLYDPLWEEAGAGHWRELSYDPAFHTYPVTETIHVDGSVATLATSASYDPGLGTMLSVTDFNSNETTVHYDTLGRLVAVVRPFDTEASPTVEYEYFLAQPDGDGGIVNFTEIRQRETAGGGQFRSREFFDGLGRKRLVKHEDEAAGSFIVKGHSSFNARRGVRSVLNPHTSESFDYEPFPAGGPVTSSDYDALGRVVRITNQDASFASTVYEPLLVRSFDENDSDPASKHFDTPMVHHNDGLGRLVRVDEIVRLDNEGHEIGNANTWTTTYTYRADDVLLTLTDSQDNFKEFRYDSLGRKTFMDDPNRGELHWVYDAASNVIATTDHKGQQILHTYDGANRLRTEDYLDEASPFSGHHIYDPEQPISAANRPDVVWFYDSPQAGLDLGDGTTGTATQTLGQIASIWDLSGEEHFSYDARARIDWQVKRLPDPVLPSLLASYRTRYSYDSADRIVTLGYPDGDHATHEYNDRFQLERILGGPSGTIISSLDYKPWDSPASIGYGNGTHTSYDYDARLRLRDLDTLGPGTATLIDFTYHLDAVGNIDRIDDNRSVTGPRLNTQVFTYDSLYRLTGVTYPGISGAQSIAYRYDRIGNMLEQSSGILHLENDLSITDHGLMSYGGPEGRSGRSGRGDSAAGPHALTGVSSGSGRSYPYDRNGNMTLIDGLTCSWDFKDRIVATENERMSARYVYDHSDRRVAKQVTPEAGQPGAGVTDSTFYINRYFEIRPGEPPVKYVWNGDTRVARITGTVSSPQRVQRLRLLAGWNLAGLNVAVDPGAFDPASHPDLDEAKWWDADTREWQTLPASEPLAAGTPIWLRAPAPSLLSVAGPRAPPAALTLAPGELRFAANPARETIPLTEVPATWEISRFDPSTQSWQSRFVGDLAAASDPLPADWSADESLLLRATNGATIPVALESALDIRYYHQDHLGSTSVVTDAYGALVEETANYPFGAERQGHRPGGIRESYGFTQKEQDRESGLHYFEARFVTSALGRFTRVDPILASMPEELLGDPQRLNGYSYSGNRPTVATDPSGEVWGLISKVAKVIIKGGDIASTVAGAIDDVNTLTSRDASLGERLIAGASLASEIVSPVSIKDAKAGIKAADRLFDGKKADRLADSIKPSLGGTGIPLNNNSARKLLRSRGATKQQARQTVASFDGPITATQGRAGDAFTVTESSRGSASGMFVTRGSAGATPAERITNLALPTSNSAAVEGQVILTRPQILLEGKVASQVGNPGFGPTATGGGHQVITDAFNGGIRRP